MDAESNAVQRAEFYPFRSTSKTQRATFSEMGFKTKLTQKPCGNPAEMRTEMNQTEEFLIQMALTYVSMKLAASGISPQTKADGLNFIAAGQVFMADLQKSA